MRRAPAAPLPAPLRAWISAKLGLLADLRASTRLFISFLESCACGSSGAARGGGAARTNAPCLYGFLAPGTTGTLSSRGRFLAAAWVSEGSARTLALAPPRLLGANLALRLASRVAAEPLPLAPALTPTVGVLFAMAAGARDGTFEVVANRTRARGLTGAEREQMRIQQAVRQNA